MLDKRVKANQIELQVRDYEGSGEAIVFLHYSGANLMMWPRVLPYFQDRYRLILVDLRGHGKSDKPETGYQIDVMARDILGVMQHLNLERAHIIGSSLGAEVGLSLAANYPDRVISLVCDGALSSEYGPFGTWEGSQAEFEEHVASQLDKMRSSPETFFPSVEAAVAASREAFEKYGWWNEYFEAMIRYGAYPAGEGKYVRSVRKQAMVNYLEGYFYCRFEDYYRRVKCPVLMLPGADLLKNDRERAAMEGLSVLAAQAEIVEVSGWEHPYGWLLDPEEMCKAILKFLSETAH